MDNNGRIFSIIIQLAVILLVFILFGIFFRKKGKEVQSLHKKYLIHLIRLILIIMVLSNIVHIFNPNTSFNTLLLRGSALVVAIVGFAAQPAIVDLICGLLISINKPFEIGDRIIVEGEQPGIVEDITLRHTVIRIYDDIRIVVPNSQLNSKTVTNTSYKMKDRRGIHLKYSVSYDTDVARASEIIRDCVAESPYTLGVTANGVKQDSGPVYFLEFAESALILDTTIWIDRNTSSYMAVTDVNLRVNEAFRKNGIEIPYNYLNVVSYEGIKKEIQSPLEHSKKSTPSKRFFRTNNVKIPGGSHDISKVMEEARHYAHKQRLDAREGGRIDLLVEEAIGVVRNITQEALLNIWIEGSGVIYRIHISFQPQIGSDEYKKLLNLSTSGRNETVKNFGDKIREIMIIGIKSTEERDKSYKWSLSDNENNTDNLGESLISAMADDVRVSVTRNKVELVIEKHLNPKQ